MVAGKVLMAGSVARAEDGACTPLDEPTFHSALAASRGFIDQEDLAGYQLASRVVTERIPCLTFVPSPSDWASFLVDHAVVAYFQGGDWKRPLATALTLVPDIDRQVGPEHEIARFVPPARPPGTGSVPDHLELYVDGVRAFEIPAPDGMHLVQVRAGQGPLRSILLVGAPLPDDFLARKDRAKAEMEERKAERSGPPPGARASAGGGFAGLAGGVGRLTQAVDAPVDYVPNVQRWAALGALAGQAWWGRPVGATVELLATPDPRLDASVLLHAQGGPVTLGLGAAFLQTSYYAGHRTQSRPVLSPAGMLALRARALDGSVSVAGGPATFARGMLQLGVSTGSHGLRLRTGLVGRLIAARFVQDETGRAVASTDWSALLQVGLAWGRAQGGPPAQHRGAVGIGP